MAEGGRTQLVKVALVGHSYVRRTSEAMVQEPRWANLRFHDSATNVEIRCFHRGGATVRDVHDGRCAYHLLQQGFFSFNPDVVYVHVGENDLNYVQAPQLADLILTFVSHIRFVRQPRVLIISQLIWFPCYEHLHGLITQVNEEVRLGLSQLNRIPPAVGSVPTQYVYWQNQCGIWGSNRGRYFLSDRVHLSAEGLRRYLWSVHNSVGRFL